jgi:hypothetical protein
VQTHPFPSGENLENAPTAELVERALRETGDLVRAEASLATAELKEEATIALFAVGMSTAAVALLAIGVACGVAAVLLAIGANVEATLFGTAGILAALSATVALVSKHMAPKRILERTRGRVSAEIREIRDRAT